MKNMLLIVNPYSGQKKAVKLLAEIIAMFNRADYAVQVYMTAGPGDATEVVARVCETVDLVVCCGGDGTFNETIAGLLRVGAKTPVGYIPAGSTNDFASSLRLSMSDLLQKFLPAVGHEYRLVDLPEDDQEIPCPSAGAVGGSGIQK